MDWVLVLYLISGSSRASGTVMERIETPWRFSTESVCIDFVARQKKGAILVEPGKSYILKCEPLRPTRVSF